MDCRPIRTNAKGMNACILLFFYQFFVLFGFYGVFFSLLLSDWVRGRMQFSYRFKSNSFSIECVTWEGVTDIHFKFFHFEIVFSLTKHPHRNLGQ
jgi:hypothetical protein